MKKNLLKIIILGIIILCGCSAKNSYTELTNVPKEYRPETAIKNGDIVNVHGTISNLDKLDRFVTNVNNNQQDKIRITSYTIEGDAILNILIFNGEFIEYISDNSRDKFGGRDKAAKKYHATKIWKEDEPSDKGDGKKTEFVSYFVNTEDNQKIRVFSMIK